MTQDSTDHDLAEGPTSRDLVVDLVGPGRDVLLVGCADGELARLLSAAGCRITGIDTDEAAAAPAVPYLERLVLGMDPALVTDTLAASGFDVMALPGSLGRLERPADLLEAAGQLLREGGRVVASVPNVAHGSVRLALLQGRWTAADGDRHHFTDHSLVDLLARAGFEPEVLRAVVADPIDDDTAVDDALILPRVIEWVRHQPTALDREYVVAARAASGDASARGVTVDPVAPYDAVRRHDRYTEQMEQDQKTRYDLLTMRDHVIGLEASVAAAQARESDARGRLRAANRELKKLREQGRGDDAATTAPGGPNGGGLGSVLRRRAGGDR